MMTVIRKCFIVCFFSIPLFIIWSCEEDLLNETVIQENNGIDTTIIVQDVDTAFVNHDEYQDWPDRNRIYHLDSFECSGELQEDIEVFGELSEEAPWFYGYGNFHGCKEGHYFKATAEINMDGRINSDTLWKRAALLLSTWQEEWILRESFTILLAPLIDRIGKKTRLISVNDEGEEASFYYYTYHSDMFLNDYEILENSDSWIEVSHLDTINGRIEGNMEVHLRKKDLNIAVYDGNPDTFSIKNIEFWAIIDPDSYH